MAVQFTRTKRKTHLQLLVYIFIMLCGSAIWLKMMLVGGSSSGLPMNMPMWMRTFDGKEIVQGLELDVDLDTCVFRESAEGGTLAEQHMCGLNNAMVSVTAKIAANHDNMDGLYLAVLASKDFTTWWQANAVLLPRDMFVFAGQPLTPQQNRSLHEAWLHALQEQALATEDTSKAALTASMRVLISSLVSPLRTFFSGAGAIELDDGTLSRFLSLQTGFGLPANETACELPPCGLSFPQFREAYVQVRSPAGSATFQIARMRTHDPQGPPPPTPHPLPSHPRPPRATPTTRTHDPQGPPPHPLPLTPLALFGAPSPPSPTPSLSLFLLVWPPLDRTPPRRWRRRRRRRRALCSRPGVLACACVCAGRQELHAREHGAHAGLPR